MSHGHTRIASKGACIYCGKKDVPLTDEHLVPFSLGGQHILEDASCHACADLTKRFEQDVAREMWGDARTSYNAPSRRKKQRKTHIVLTDPDNPSRRVKVPYSEYPAAMIFYKMSRAGLLEGMPDSVDLSAACQFTAFPVPCETGPPRAAIDWRKVHEEMKRPSVTLVLLWQEYRAEQADGYGYSRFCDLYGEWRKTISATMRQTHPAGEKLFVDYAGDTVPVFDQITDAQRPAHIFVAALGASNYTYA
jgi:hypothetical protein